MIPDPTIQRTRPGPGPKLLKGLPRYAMLWANREMEESRNCSAGTCTSLPLMPCFCNWCGLSNVDPIPELANGSLVDAVNQLSVMLLQEARLQHSRSGSVDVPLGSFLGQRSLRIALSFSSLASLPLDYEILAREGASLHCFLFWITFPPFQCTDHGTPANHARSLHTARTFPPPSFCSGSLTIQSNSHRVFLLLLLLLLLLALQHSCLALTLLRHPPYTVPACLFLFLPRRPRRGLHTPAPPYYVPQSQRYRLCAESALRDTTHLPASFPS